MQDFARIFPALTIHSFGERCDFSLFIDGTFVSYGYAFWDLSFYPYMSMSGGRTFLEEGQ